MNTEFTLRYATKKDTETIAQYNMNMATETEDTVLNKDIITAGVKALMKKKQYGFYVVAEKHNQIIGQLMITFEWSDWRNGLIWWIQSVYIHSDFRRMGVYKSLYNFVKNEADAQDIKAIRLYVHEENKRAQNTYESLGMEKSHYIMYETEL